MGGYQKQWKGDTKYLTLLYADVAQWSIVSGLVLVCLNRRDIPSQSRVFFPFFLSFLHSTTSCRSRVLRCGWQVLGESSHSEWRRFKKAKWGNVFLSRSKPLLVAQPPSKKRVPIGSLSKLLMDVAGHYSKSIIVSNQSQFICVGSGEMYRSRQIAAFTLFTLTTPHKAGGQHRGCPLLNVFLLFCCPFNCKSLPKHETQLPKLVTNNSTS